MQILKLDHFAGLHRASLQAGPHPQPRLDGAPNFRRLDGVPIYGLAQPTLEGICQVLQEVGSGPVCWINLREEPVLYVEGDPYSLRESDYPYMNAEDPGIKGEQLEEFEAGLRQEMLARGEIRVYGEDNERHLTQHRVVGDPQEMLTVRQAFAMFPEVQLVRIPVSDERAPEIQDFDALQRLLYALPLDRPRIFNCQVGQGRTTTGMVIADLVEQARRGGLQHLREEFDETEQSLFDAVGSLPTTRAEADASIARSSFLIDLRDSILHPPPAARGHALSTLAANVERARDYLRRYYLLVAFTRYLEGEPSQSFSHWMEERPQFLHSLKLMQRSLGLAEL